MQKIFFQRTWQSLMGLSLVNLLLFVAIAWLMQKPQLKVLPTEVVFLVPSLATTALSSPSPFPSATSTVSSSPSSTMILRPSPTTSATETAIPTVTALIPTTISPNPMPTASIEVFIAPPVQNFAAGSIGQVMPLVLVNPNEPIPIYATVPVGLEEFAQASFRYVYGQRPIRNLSANQSEVQIGFVLDMETLQWGTGAGIVQLACNLWRNGFATQTYTFIGYQENILGLDVTYQDKLRVNLTAAEVPQMPCAAPETLDLPSFANFYWRGF